MKNSLIFVKTIASLFAKLKSRFSRRASSSSYTIFNSIPHRRVISKNAVNEEIFDLYQLGTFSAPSTSFYEEVNEEYEMQENVELVELQPQTEYRPHYHQNSAAVIYIASGYGTFLLGDKCIDYRTGKRIVIPAGLMHGFNTQTRTLFLSIQSPPIIDPTTGEVDLHYHNEEQA
ncbi:MAG: hypothetical protein K0S11_1420 [Gammaproteobacteria bacterium]|jgi:quercetin dioxygenase-like cupin family protein|nr:hypothetical protein [Gammaproteobacteria bacterium]